MARRMLLLAFLGVGTGWIGVVPTSLAQVGTTGNIGTGMSRPSPFGLGMPGGNPAFNPLLNPMVMPYTSNPDVMWYLYATGQYYGSSIPGTQGGRLNGDPNAATPADPSAPKKQADGRAQKVSKPQGGRRPGSRLAAEMPISSATPGAGAAGFFYRGANAKGGTGRYFNRPLTQFQNNGR